MSNKENKLILEEYNSEFGYENSKLKLEISFNRISFILFIFFIISIIFSLKVIYLGSLQIKEDKTQISQSNFRSDILDRNGNVVAKSVLTTNIGIDPKLVINKENLLINLKIIFPDKNFKEIEKKLNSNKFFYIEKKISKKDYSKLLLIGDKSIREEQKISRVYPQKNLFSHIVGQIDSDNNGISGLEKSYNFELTKNNEPLNLTVDTYLQHLIKEQLVLFSNIFHYKGSAAILMDINNGEILSMVSLPDFDLNKREKIFDPNFINRATKGVYELGSVFKTFTLAAALNYGVVDMDTKFENLEKKIWCAGNPISEYDYDIPSSLTAEEILIRSGNIGSVRIAQKVGAEKFKIFLENLGIINKIDFDIEEVGTPENIVFGKCKLATSSFGHGISTTLLQLVKAYAIISNGGFLVEPTLIINKKIRDKKKIQIINKGISKKINLTLRKVVSTKEGTAGFANIPGYEVGGKTGTAQKVSNGKYSNKKINTFASIFPISEPKFILVVLLDEPLPNKDYVYNYKDGSGFKYKGNHRNTAGWTSVEVAGKIIEKIGPIIATKY